MQMVEEDFTGFTSRNRKICPLLSMGVESVGYCPERRCAWWDPVIRLCAIRFLAGVGGRRDE